MLGALRLILATMVVANHLWKPAASLLGMQAVLGFFIISGFLMTKTLHEVYGWKPAGIGRYLVNRTLRIYPPYLLVLFLSAALLLSWPAAFDAIGPTFRLPANKIDWIKSITLIDCLDLDLSPMPQSWSLTVEFFFYIAMALGLSRNRITALTWLCLSIGIAIVAVSAGASREELSFSLHSGSLFFSLGACLYFYRSTLVQMFSRLPRFIPVALIVLFCFSQLIAQALGYRRYVWGFYPAAIIFVPIFFAALSITTQRWDRVLGDLAYPVFLSHFLAASLVNAAMPALAPYSFWFFVASLLLTFSISAFLVVAFWWLEALRASLRPGTKPERPILLQEYPATLSARVS
jgi:peptidoglycan/LPS O-acetylase OafA/YrhL